MNVYISQKVAFNCQGLNFSFNIAGLGIFVYVAHNYNLIPFKHFVSGLLQSERFVLPDLLEGRRCCFDTALLVFKKSL